jgi:hypothetical protein
VRCQAWVRKTIIADLSLTSIVQRLELLLLIVLVSGFGCGACSAGGAVAPGCAPGADSPRSPDDGSPLMAGVPAGGAADQLVARDEPP